MKAGILLARHGGLSIEAREDALYAFTARPGVRLSRVAEWPEGWLDSPLALQAALQLSHLVELGLAEEAAEFLRIPYASFPALSDQGFTIPLLWSDWSPFTLSIRTQGSLSEGGLRFSASFRLGDMEVQVERAGRYICRAGRPETWLLDEVTSALLNRLELPANDDERWIDFAFVKEYASELGAEMDSCLRHNEVIFPAAIRIARTPGSIRGALEPLVDEVPGEVFQRAYRACSTIGRRLLVPLPAAVCGHLIFDDNQLDSLNTLKSSGGFTATEPPPAPIVGIAAGRVGFRQTAVASQWKTVPVRLRSEAALPAGQPVPGVGHVVYDRELQNMRRSRLEALVACVYASRGFGVVLTAEGGGLGAAVIGVRDGDVWLVRVEAGPAGVESLDALARMRAAYRRLADHPYRLALVVRTCCSPEFERRMASLRVDLTDGARLIDEVEAKPITYEQVLQAERLRCRSMLDAVERLQLLMAGHFAEEFE